MVIGDITNKKFYNVMIWLFKYLPKKKKKRYGYLNKRVFSPPARDALYSDSCHISL